MKGDVIGIVGQGFVGGSINEGMKEHYTIETYDKFVKSKSTCNSIAELTDKCIIMFVCFPDEGSVWWLVSHSQTDMMWRSGQPVRHNRCTPMSEVTKSLSSPTFVA